MTVTQGDAARAARPRYDSHHPSDATTVAGSHGLWARLPDDLVELFLPSLPDLVGCMVREIQQAVPSYATADALTGQLVATGVECAVTRCLDDILDLTGPDGPAGHDEWRSMFIRFGAREYRRAGTLDDLLAAYRAAGQAAWRYLGGWGRTLELSPEVLCDAAEAVFATVSDVSALSVDGYAGARTNDRGPTERNRARLVTLLVSDPPPTAAAVAALAEDAEWSVPERIRVVAIAPADAKSAPGVALDPDVLRDLDGPRPCLVTGAPETHLARLDARLGGRRAAIGPLVPVTAGAESHRCARRALEMVAAGTLSDEPVLHCDRHMLSMWLTADPFLADRVGRQVLDPLAGVPRRQAERLAETLLSWLRHQGHVVDVAQALRIHPQTVRYRLNQLTELFGDRLNDPDQRLAMEMALHTGRLVGGGPGTSAS